MLRDIIGQIEIIENIIYEFLLINVGFLCVDIYRNIIKSVSNYKIHF